MARQAGITALVRTNLFNASAFIITTSTSIKPGWPRLGKIVLIAQCSIRWFMVSTNDAAAISLTDHARGPAATSDFHANNCEIHSCVWASESEI